MLILSRDHEIGKITYQEYYDLGPAPGGRWDFGSVAIAPDGRTIYATNSEADKLFVLDCEPDRGALHTLQTINHIHPAGVIVFPDNRHIYVRHFDTGGNFAIYSQDSQTRNFVLIDDFQTRRGFQLPSGVCVSPRGDAIYMTSEDEHTVIHRDTTTGKLSVVQQFDNNVGGTDRLIAVNAVATSPDGKYLYVGAERAISIFSCGTDESDLTLMQSYPLTFVSDMKISPDGKHLYVTDEISHTLEVFARDSQTGRLQWVETQKDSARTGWSWPMTFSPDGRHLFVTNRKELSVFARERNSGRVTPLQRINGAEYNLKEILAMTVSPDGAHVYWSGYPSRDFDYQITTFSRDSVSGLLTFKSKSEFALLRPSTALAVSPDGQHVYATLSVWDQDEDTGEIIGVFSRDHITGKLSLIDIFHFNGWNCAVALAIAANGIDVYATVDDDYAHFGLLLMLERSPETGRLTQRQIFQNWENGVRGLAFPFNMVLSPDDAFLYIGDYTGGIATFSTGRGNNTAAETQGGDQTPPLAFALHPNHPNPFNPTTLIKYDLPKATHVTITIYDVLGRRVRTLVDKLMDAGYHSRIWDGRNDKGAPVTSGIYFYRLHTTEFMKVRKMALLQ
ncbi:MAG: beta-propeller fold lactonase family protein [candidate division KSB1 bacterium]|nr:beta-propeller fold lactonase family protein [candidate division KSB1 bacterium]MDZ7304082.1 beta-propeller fold lactonase family protein [candidate division KSB1 bacterium]MDZ7312062.1 beta-propeller fold lactonase family protein [candidate division KSB1 bacterium]